MNYYLVAPLEGSARHSEGFTYQSDVGFGEGNFVRIPLGKKQSLGIVIKAVPQPAFATKAITSGLEIPSLPAPVLQLVSWISEYYATPLSQVLRNAVPPRPDIEREVKAATPTKLSLLVMDLQAQQTAVLNHIKTSKALGFLLHGATGSGKTQVYIELARAYLSQGKSGIILVPEIALTSQMVDQFSAVFAEQVIVTHSGLTSSQRRAIWQKILRAATPLLVIGPRSALFSPVPNLGLIVVDESHEPSYKQSQAPRYYTLPVALHLSKLTSAKVVFGSATPSTYEIHLAAKGILDKLAMPDKVHKPSQPPVEIIDMRRPEVRSSSRIFSKPLLTALRETLQLNQQSLLFINRRGSASQIVCKDCGWVALCSPPAGGCQIPLTFHADEAALRCHWCGHKQPPPAACPRAAGGCGSLDLRFLGIGTKRLEAEVAKFLPGARVSRLDRDSLASQHLGRLMEDLHTGKIDILIGTQMIAKGLDIPSVATVGVVLADTSLYIPDYTSSERTYQLLHQVSGRAGRRVGIPARTFIQTYSPEHSSILAVKSGDFDGFIKQELLERKLLNYPPYTHLLKLEARRASRDSAKGTAQKLADQLIKFEGIEVIGPAPAFRERLQGRFTWQLIIKARKRDRLVEVVRHLPSNWTFDLDPIDLL